MAITTEDTESTEKDKKREKTPGQLFLIFMFFSFGKRLCDLCVPCGEEIAPDLERNPCLLPV
jgi:hypothetical protein